MSRRVVELGRALGDPGDPENPLGYSQTLDRDEHDRYAADALKVLDHWNFGREYIPASLGGGLESLWQLGALLRSVARRDCAVAASHVMSFFAALPIWQSGDAELSRRVCGLIEEGKRISIAFHEQEHGSDLQANELSARADGAHYVLDGEKWCVGNPEVAQAALIYARTSERGHGRDHTLFFVPREPGRDSFAPTVRFRTHGVRAHNVGGLRLSGHRVESSARVGMEGTALEAALRASCVSKPTAASLSLAMLESALRCAGEFACERVVYGRRVIDLPYVQAIFAEVYADLCLGEALWIGALRGLHFFPRQAALVSSAAKWAVTQLCEQAVVRLSAVLGARAFLREGHPWGIFGKIWRDAAFPRLGHYNTATGSQAIAVQLGQRVREDKDRPKDAEVGAAFSLKSATPPLALAEIPIGRKGACWLGLSAGSLRDRCASAGLSDVGLDAVGTLGARYLELERAAVTSDPWALSTYRRAEGFAWALAGVSLVEFWLHNRSGLLRELSPAHLRVALERVLPALGERALPVSEEARSEIAAQLSTKIREGRALSLIDCPMSAVDD